MTRKMMALPENMTIFVQPPGLLPIRDERGHVVEFPDNPKAENMKNLRPGYYRSQLSGSTPDATLNILFAEHLDVDVVPPEDWASKKQEMAALLLVFLQQHAG